MASVEVIDASFVAGADALRSLLLSDFMRFDGCHRYLILGGRGAAGRKLNAPKTHFEI